VERVGSDQVGSDPVGGGQAGAGRVGVVAVGPDRRAVDSPILRSDRSGYEWATAGLETGDLIGGLQDTVQDVVEDALEVILLREAERHGLDTGAP